MVNVKSAPERDSGGKVIGTELVGLKCAGNSARLHTFGAFYMNYKSASVDREIWTVGVHNMVNCTHFSF